MSTQIDLSISQLTAAQRTAVQTAAPIIKTYLHRCIRIYRRMTPDQQTIFLAKNQVLANIINAVQEALD